MNALHEESGTTHEDAKVARAPWRRPSFRVLPVRDAEIGVAINVSDGAFTTS
jgi:hypothetical protein